MSVHTFNGELTCAQAGELLPGFVSETLAPEVHGQVQQHILVCEPCSVALADAVFAAMAARELPPVDVPPLPRAGRERIAR